MRRWMGLPIVVALALTACVTINVYFPAAEAKEAAKEFVDKVIGDDVQPAPPAPASGGGVSMRGLRAQPVAFAVSSPGFDPLMLLGIAPAHAQAQPDITVRTPAIEAIRARMKGRFDTALRQHFDAGALGFSSDGSIAVHDAAKVGLSDRVAVNQAVADQNRDASAVYREIAVANNHPEWEAQIRSVFASQWVERAKPGWWYQDAGGWKQK
ncbi:MAG: DUF1318 domain-containing protein [Luteimonas sp.]